MKLSNEGYVLHSEPVWRDRSDFIINARLAETDFPNRFEQLFARKVTTNTFEICCIPFFLWDVALGDMVSTTTIDGREYVMDAVIRRSGRFVFRIWFGSSDVSRDDVLADLTTFGVLLEWSSQNLLAVDAMNAKHARRVAEYLAARESATGLEWETGRR